MLCIVFKVTYPGRIDVDLGNELTPLQTKQKPNVTWDFEWGTYYTLLKIDPDAPTRRLPLLRELRHWLVINIPGCFVERGDEIYEYIPASPPPLSGSHRYIFLVFKQYGRIHYDGPRINKE